jgi:ribosomal protein L22
MYQYSISSTKVIRFSIQKLQRIIILFKNKSCKKTLFLLMFYPNKIAKILCTLVNAGVHNFQTKYKINNKEIYIKTITLQKKSFLKRLDYKARGQVSTILKPTAKIKIIFTTNRNTIHN